MKFKKALAKRNPEQNRAFVTLIKKYFELERLRDKPMAWQDIWVYNYFLYDMRSHRIGLIAKYEKQVNLPVEKHFKEVCKILDGRA